MLVGGPLNVSLIAVVVIVLCTNTPGQLQVLDDIESQSHVIGQGMPAY